MPYNKLREIEFKPIKIWEEAKTLDYLLMPERLANEIFAIFSLELHYILLGPACEMYGYLILCTLTKNIEDDTIKSLKINDHL